MISPVLYDICTEEQVQIIKDVLTEKCNYMTSIAEEHCEEGMQDLINAGVEILELTDDEVAAFADMERSTNWGDTLDGIFGTEVMDGVYADLGIER